MTSLTRANYSRHVNCRPVSRVKKNLNVCHMCLVGTVFSWNVVRGAPHVPEDSTLQLALSEIPVVCLTGCEFLFNWHTSNCTTTTKRYSYPCSRSWKPIDLRDVEVPTLSRQSAHRLIRRPRSTPQKHFFLLLVLISVRGWVNPKPSAAGRIK
jgi:hypothetical protein